MKGYLHWQILVPYVNMHGIDRSVKPAVIMIVDGGPHENSHCQKTADVHAAVHHF